MTCLASGCDIRRRKQYQAAGYPAITTTVDAQPDLLATPQVAAESPPIFQKQLQPTRTPPCPTPSPPSSSSASLTSKCSPPGSYSSYPSDLTLWDSTTSTWRTRLDPLAHTHTPAPETTTRASFLDSLSQPPFNTTGAIYRTFASSSLTGPFDEELISRLPPSCKFIVHNGAGYDQLSIPALTAKGIIACNVPTAVDDATADTALFLLIGALRNFNAGMAALRRGQWRGVRPPALGRDPQGLVLGVLGMGGIGRNFATKAESVGMKVIYHSRRRVSDEAELERRGWRYVGVEELLGRADVVSVHVPLNEGTRHLLGRKELGMMKDGVVVINTARGAVIDEAALVQALESGKVASAGLDVYEGEPGVHEGLVRDERCVLVPHMGTWCGGTQRRMEEWCIANLVCAVKGGKEWERMSVVPEQKEFWEKTRREEKV